MQYAIRHSKRARYLQLRISSKGLEVIVPEKKPVSPAMIEQFIQQKASWIKRNTKRFGSMDASTLVLPEELYLSAISERWEIKYLQTGGPKITLMTNHNNQLSLIGNTKNKKLCLVVLHNWLKTKAFYPLEKILNQLSKETNLTYNQLTIRHNGSRWGSCSTKKNISLCCKLLFLSPHLVHHVLLHELCHTKVMHHGKAFWQLFKKFDHSAKEHAKELRLASIELPKWIREKS